MLLADSQKKTVLLLGAGASRGAIAHVLHRRKRIKPPLNGDFFKVADTYARARRRFLFCSAAAESTAESIQAGLTVEGSSNHGAGFQLAVHGEGLPGYLQDRPGRREAAGVRREIDDFLRLLFPILTVRWIATPMEQRRRERPRCRPGRGAGRARAPPRRDRSPAAPPPAGAATAAGFFSSRIDFRTTSPGSKITCVGRAGRRNSNACVASDTLTRSSRSRPSISKRTGAENLNGGASGVIGCFCAMRSVPIFRSSSHSQRPSSSGWPGRAIQRSSSSSTLRPLASSMARARSRVSTDPWACLPRVEADRPPEGGVAQLVPQHVEDASALLVEVRVEQVNRLLVLPADDGALIAPGLGQVTVGVDQQLEVRLVASLGVLAPDVLEVRREALVQPRLGPLAARQQVAPPLVRQLVRHQPLDVVIDRGALVEQDQLGQRRRGGVLHAAEDELGDGDLAVARVGVGDADALREEVDHLGRAPEAAARVGLASRRNEVEDVDAGARCAVGDLHERAGHQRHQVGGLGELERVVPAHAARRAAPVRSRRTPFDSTKLPAGAAQITSVVNFSIG